MDISAQVKELREYSNISLYTRESRARELLKEAADTIEAISAKLKAANMERSADCGGWIPCSERLPDEEKYYLVTIIDWRKKSAIEYCLFQNGKWYLVADGSYEENTSWKEEIESVIAWSEPPEPYHES